MKLGVQKDKEGHRLMLKLCRPRTPRLKDGEKAGGLYWHEDPAELQRLFEYCLQDVAAEHALSEELPDLSPSEQKVWHLDQRINERGVQVDVETSTQIIKLVFDYSAVLQEEVSRITSGEIQSVKQVGKMTEHLGISSLTKGSVARAIETETDPDKLRLLMIRQELGLASVSKYQAIVSHASRDGRIRGMFLYHGAGTGRWTGRGFQPQNLPRKGVPPEYLNHALAFARDLDLLWIENCFGDVMTFAQALIRPMITAAPGKELITADFASIEARVLLWLAEEDLSIFAGDPYCEMAQEIYGYPVAKKTHKLERQVGKTAILGLGYGMGAKKFRLTCKTNAGVTLDKKMGRKVVKTYREKFPGVPDLWRGVQNAAFAAVKEHQETSFGLTLWFMAPPFLCCRLPSGRTLFYPYPEIRIEPAFIFRCRDIETGDEKTVRVVGEGRGPDDVLAHAKMRADDEDYELLDMPPIPREQETLTYMTMKDGRWQRDKTYGGKLVENVDQATARDLMAEAMLRVEAAGYPVVMSVHDELVSEVPLGFGSVAEYESLMSVLPAWAEGCPIAAEGWRGERYRK
jgi:DNA polymerase